MSCGVDRHVGRTLAVVTDSDFADVQNGQVVVSKEVLANFNVFAVIALEGRVDKGIFGLTENLLG
jgi:hypothetical protein